MAAKHVQVPPTIYGPYLLPLCTIATGRVGDRETSLQAPRLRHTSRLPGEWDPWHAGFERAGQAPKFPHPSFPTPAMGHSPPDGVRINSEHNADTGVFVQFLGSFVQASTADARQWYAIDLEIQRRHHHAIHGRGTSVDAAGNRALANSDQ
jgi:hypothetical protein